MARWIQDPVTHELIPAEQYRRKVDDRAFIRGDIEPFVSPIDGSVITSRSTLREHNRRHGVADMREWGDRWYEKKAKERREAITGKADRAERIETLKRTLYEKGVTN